MPGARKCMKMFSNNHSKFTSLSETKPFHDYTELMQHFTSHDVLVFVFGRLGGLEMICNVFQQPQPRLPFGLLLLQIGLAETEVLPHCLAVCILAFAMAVPERSRLAMEDLTTKTETLQNDFTKHSLLKNAEHIQVVPNHPITCNHTTPITFSQHLYQPPALLSCHDTLIQRLSGHPQSASPTLMHLHPRTSFCSVPLP